jgi:DNA-binding transcriptional LysR family regulator
MIATAYSGLLQRFIRGFQDKFPGIEITLHQVSTVQLVGAILANELDAGFAREPSQYPSGLGVIPFSRAPVVLALPGDHPLARKNGAISPRALAGEPFVSTSIGYDLAFTRHAEAIAKLGGFTPNIVKRAEDLTTVLTYVSLGYGIAAVSRDMTNCHAPNVVFRRIAARDVPEVMFSFMYRTRESVPAIRALIETVREQAVKNGAVRRAS